MYGPCLDKAPSLKMTCLQHYAFYPHKVFGKFFFPKQRPLTPTLWSEYFADEGRYLPKHLFLSHGVSSSPYNGQDELRPPSAYGLGKLAVESNLEGIEFRYISNQSVNEVLTQQFKKPFQNDNGVEQWMKWAQYFCYSGCHRRSRYSVIDIQNVNINDDPELAFLSVFKNEASRYQSACRPCPRYTASYNWIDVTSSPAHPKINPWADQCYPWFGAIPTVILLGERYVLNTTFRNRESPSDLVVFPDSDSEVYMHICPVNTFNRVCAHTLEGLYNTAPSSPITCRPCPSGGYHTGGKEGQWYCQPPPGKVFKSPGREILQSEIANDVWGDRDKMSIYPELECGPEKIHCRQCEEYNLRETTPEQFNELLVFSLLLAEEICQEGSFCPNAFTKTQCPIEVPWSPVGSWHVSNCTCVKGSYFNGSSCIPCTTVCDNQGYYLPKSQCIEKNGATKDASCIKCNNIPDEWALADDVGVELRAGFGTCPYHCLWGSEMYVMNASIGNCEKKRVCLPPRVRKNKEGRFVYKENLAMDSLAIKKMSSSFFSCTPSPLFTEQLSKIDSEWYQQPQSCIGVCDSSRICYAANKSSTIDPNVPWYSFFSVLNCSLCPTINELPPMAYLQIDTGSDLQMGVQYCQDPKIFCSGIADKLYYFNRSARLCQSCDEREREICAPLTRLRGGGCLGVNSPFNDTVPSADCVQCSIRVPVLNESKGKQYLNYRNSSAVGGCSIDPCLPLPSLYYWGRPCGADFAGEYSRCSDDCPLNNFRKTECTEYTNLICQNCTKKRLGYKKISNCTTTTDSGWQLCDAGDYCDDTGSVHKCPSGRTSLLGAKYLSDCFCKVGTQEDATTNLCVPMQCANTKTMPNLPGLSLNSSHYMTLDLGTLSSTKCIPCSSTSPSAYTRGDGIEITSCICPRGFYGLYNSDRTQIQCMPCPLSPSCITNQKMPASCWEGDLKLTIGQSFPCVCTNAPFTTVPSTLCSSSCLSNFLPTATATNRVIRSGSNPQVSGSSIYSVRKGQMTNVWNRFISSSGYQNSDNVIKSIALTGYMDDSVLGNDEGQNLQVYHYEYVFWSIADAGIPVVFSALLQENLVDMAQQELLYLPQWSVFVNDFLPVDIIIGIAASKWNIMEPFFSNGNSRDPWIYVAALIGKMERGGLFSMKAKVFNTTNRQNYGFWEDVEYNLALPFPDTIQHATPVSITHSTKQIGEKSIGSEGGFFFIAFNVLDPSLTSASCGGLFSVSPILINNIILINKFCSKISSSVSITSMAVTLNPDSSVPMILLALSSGNALKIESPMQIDVSLFFPVTTASEPILNLIILFSLNSPVYISGMYSDNNDFYSLKVADTTQMSWIDIQGLPWGTSPASQPMTMGGSVISRGKALLVVSSGSALFTIPLYRCPSPTQYWDGAVCVEHACIRPTSCGMNMEAMDGGCVCKSGYYKNPMNGLCLLCSSPYYCDRVSSISCPLGTATTKSGASSVNECICSIGGSFFNALALQPRCFECKSVDTWCPNRWLSFSCPGTFTSSLQLLSTPVSFPTKCTCASGYTGVNCDVCPEGFYCPVSSASLVMNTAAYYTFHTTPLASMVIGHIHNFFLSYFTQPGTKILKMNSVQDLNKVLYIQKVQATNQTRFGIMVMVQVDSGGGAVDNFKGWNRDLFEYLRSLSTNVSDVTPGVNSNVDFSMAPINKPLQCLTSKVPASPPSSCICAAGYETQKEQCSACPVNTFKAIPGPGTCVACAIGTVSPIRASTCIPDPSLLNPSQETNGPDTTLLIGGIVGGVIGLICLLSIVQLVVRQGRK